MYCECGCGQVTSIAKVNTRSRGYVKGKHLRFLQGHGCRKHPHGYSVVDTGYMTPCWIWNGRKTKGYAHTWHNGRERSAHIVFYEKQHGPVPEGLQIDHLCRQKACVRTSHLEAVTTTENTRRGDRSKLSVEHVAAAKALCESGWTHKRIADLFGVTKTSIGDAIRERTWRMTS